MVFSAPSMIHGDDRFHKKNVFVPAHYRIYREQHSIIRGVTKIEFVLVKRKGLFFVCRELQTCKREGNNLEMKQCDHPNSSEKVKKAGPIPFS